MALTRLYREQETYRRLLQQVMKDQGDLPKNKFNQLTLFAKPDRVRVATSTYQRDAQKRVDLIYPLDELAPNEHEEIVCVVQGFIARAQLPPITSRHQLSKNPLATRQAITLTGLGLPEFDACARGILEVHGKLASVLPADSLQSWKPIIDQGHICLEFTNRYFAGESDLWGQGSIEMNPTIDPLGILRENVPQGLHTEDNAVLYFDRVQQAETGEFKYGVCNPASIKPGQLVEVQVTFCAVPIAKGKYLMLSKLRSVCILSRQVQKDVDDALISSLRGTPSSPLKKVKRNVGYDTGGDSDDHARLSLKRLKITDETDGNWQMETK